MTVRFVLAGLLVCSSMGLAQTADPCATAPESCATLITTRATAETRIANTVVDVTVGVSASGKDLPEVQRALAEQSNKLLAYLKGQQVERLITTRISFTPDIRYEKPEKTVGYNGSARVSFRAMPAKVADLLAGVLTNGANRIESTTFTPTEEEVTAARRRLSEDATKTAVAQADAIANAAGMKVDAIRNISVDSDSGFVPPYPNQSSGNFDSFEMKSRVALSPMQAASGDDQLSVRVNITAAATR